MIQSPPVNQIAIREYGRRGPRASFDTIKGSINLIEEVCGVLKHEKGRPHCLSTLHQISLIFLINNSVVHKEHLPLAMSSVSLPKSPPQFPSIPNSPTKAIASISSFQFITKMSHDGDKPIPKSIFATNFNMVMVSLRISIPHIYRYCLWFCLGLSHHEKSIRILVISHI